MWTKHALSVDGEVCFF